MGGLAAAHEVLYVAIPLLAVPAVLLGEQGGIADVSCTGIVGSQHHAGSVGHGRTGENFIQSFEKPRGSLDVLVRVDKGERVNAHSGSGAGHNLHEARGSGGVGGFGMEARLCIGDGCQPLPVPLQGVGVLAEDAVVGADGEGGNLAVRDDGVVEDGRHFLYNNGGSVLCVCVPFCPYSTQNEGCYAQHQCPFRSSPVVHRSGG